MKAVTRKWIPCGSYGALCLAVFLTGCTSGGQTVGVRDGDANVAAQDSTATQYASPEQPTPPMSLAQLERNAATHGPSSSKQAARLMQVRQAGLRYGLDGGLAYGTAEIDGIVRSQANDLTRTWDFGALMINAPYGIKILPPVIESARNIYQQNSPTVVVIASRRYHILQSASFAPVQPLWESYLLQPWSKVPSIKSSDLPKNAAEKAVFNEAVKDGWVNGEREALDTFKYNLHRMETEYLGMIRWSRLVAIGAATTPVVISAMKPVTGGGDTVTLNKGVVKIVSGARLVGAH